MEKTDLTPIIAIFSEFFTSIYKPKIDKLLLVYPKKKSLEVDYGELERFDPDIADKLVKEPDLIIEAAEKAIDEMNLALPSGEHRFAPHVRLENVPSGELLIEQLSSRNINELVAFKGVVTKRAEVMNRVKIAVYRCQICDSTLRLPVVKNFSPPKRCDSCKKLALKQMDDESDFVDIQRAEVQELLERVTGGAPAARIELLFEDDLVNTANPGENIELVGMLRLRPPMKSRQKQELVYTRYLEVNNIKSLKRDFEEIEISKEDEKRIMELAEDPNIEKVMVDSVAPSIYGHEEVKWAIALQLFGGTKGKTMKGGAKIRDDIHLLLIGDPGLAKCVSGDSKIVLADGTITEIKKVVDEVLEKDAKQDPEGYYAFSNHDILSLGLDAKVEKEKANVFWKLQSPEYLYEIETYTGKHLIVTAEHPFFTIQDGFIRSKNAMDVKDGEFIASPHSLPIKGTLQKIEMPEHGRTNANTLKLPQFINEEFARLLGYLIGDGYVRRTSSFEISLTNSDKELLDDFKNIMTSFSLPVYMKKRKGSTCASSFSVDLGKILYDMGLVKDSFNKRVPLGVMKSPNKIVREFLKAYFDCEAHVNKDGIAVVSASKDLLEEVGVLLLRFGIITQLHANWSRATNAINHPRTRYWRLMMCGKNAKMYIEEIGFTAAVKINAAKKIPKLSNTNIDVVPNLKRILKETRIGLGLSQFDCNVPRTTYQHYERGDRNPSYEKLKKIASAFSTAYKDIGSTDEDLEKNIVVLEKTSESDVFWDRIEAIRKIKSPDRWVYDLQVDKLHNFVANSIFVHNSRFLQQCADIAPKSIYVSGKTVSGVGLCVSGDSLITLNDAGVQGIGDFVEENFSNGSEEIEGAFSSRFGSKVVSLNDDLKFDYQYSQKIWKIKPPKKMIKLCTQRGKEIKITPNTQLISIENGKPEWIKSSKVSQGDVIATTRSMCPLKGKPILTINLIENKNARVVSKEFIGLTDRLAKKYGSLQDVANRYGFDRERLYINRSKKQGVRLSLLKEMAMDADMDPSEVSIDAIFLRYGQEHKLPLTINPEVCYLAGLVAGDGDIHLKDSTGFVRFHSDDEQLLREFRQIVERNFGIETRVKDDGKRIVNIVASSLILAEILTKLGVPAGEKCHRVDIPKLLTSSGKENVKAYLQGFFDTDGWAYHGKKCSSSVGICTVSKKLAQKILLLLEWWGVNAKLRTRKDRVGKRSIIKGKEVVSKREQYYVEIRGIDNLTRFRDEIGFKLESKRKKLDMIIKESSKSGNPNNDIVPVMPYLKELRKKYRLPLNKIGKVFFHRSNPSRKKLLQIIQYLPEGEDRNLLNVLAYSDIYWDKIIEKSEYKPEDEWVYDLTVDGSHNFIANGIIVHNTVSAEKDELGDGGWTLKAGALVLASGGMAMIDEFDKIDEEDRAALHEAMESAQISIAKAGMVAKFRTKTAILAAANPKWGRFDQNKNLADQFHISPTLLTRFDLIFPIVDVLDEEKDSKLAAHILKTHMGGDTGEEYERLVDKELLRKYISYSRRNIQPKLSKGASVKIKEFYVDLRRKGKDTGSVTITPRYLEGLVRLAEANAKIRLSETVEERDAEMAIKLLNHVMRQVMTDKETGAFDVDVIATGKPKSEREKLQKEDTIMEIIREMLKSEDSADLEKVVSAAMDSGIDEKEAKRYLSALLKKGEIYEKEHGHVKIVGG